ncbi:hypothetical protein UlMin_032458 [Ulmus minor]
MATQMSKKQKFVADGVFFAELNEVLTKELAEDGYSGVEVRVMPMRTKIIIRATRTQNVLGEKGRRIRELTSVAQKHFKFPENSVELYAEKAEPLRYKLLGGLAIRRKLCFLVREKKKGCMGIFSDFSLNTTGSMNSEDNAFVSVDGELGAFIDVGEAKKHRDISNTERVISEGFQSTKVVNMIMHVPQVWLDSKIDELKLVIQQ